MLSAGPGPEYPEATGPSAAPTDPPPGLMPDARVAPDPVVSYLRSVINTAPEPVETTPRLLRFVRRKREAAAAPAEVETNLPPARPGRGTPKVATAAGETDEVTATADSAALTPEEPPVASAPAEAVLSAPEPLPETEAAAPQEIPAVSVAGEQVIEAEPAAAEPEPEPEPLLEPAFTASAAWADAPKAEMPEEPVAAAAIATEPMPRADAAGLAPASEPAAEATEEASAGPPTAARTEPLPQPEAQPVPEPEPPPAPPRMVLRGEVLPPEAFRAERQRAEPARVITMRPGVKKPPEEETLEAPGRARPGQG